MQVVEVQASLTDGNGTVVANRVATGTNQYSYVWAHWGLGGFDKFDHKNGVTPQISNYTWVGSSWIGDRPVNWLADNPTRFSWTDGTPTNSALNTPTGVFTSMAGNGFQITVP
ncbi:MAG TPA: hypothetical protein VER76_05440, partial [Pyrinomonadaceae bacterium]|nr:hypothetical protein [Pyrinomonadaceae bacterium]